MKNVNWGKVFETIAYMGAMGIGICILYSGFEFLIHAFKTTF
jgi:hypothetical protein